MKTIAGVDIGNSTTEVCIGQMDDSNKIKFLSSSSVQTTGIKGTVQNVHGIKDALSVAVKKANINLRDIDILRINEAAPVIGDTAMETITETIITSSTMIGHNPNTPAGRGVATGVLCSVGNITRANPNDELIVVVNGECDYNRASTLINNLSEKFNITGLILENDEAKLVWNRLNKKIPIIDEVRNIKAIPDGVEAAIEVAVCGESIRMLSNPYGIATLLKLTPTETKSIIPIAKSLIGKKSGVVIKAPQGSISENVLPAGKITVSGFSEDGKELKMSIDIDSGGEQIMNALNNFDTIIDIHGEENTNIGNMLASTRNRMNKLTENGNLKIKDLLAVDTFAEIMIAGNLAGETCLEKAVGVAAMVKTDALPMGRIADLLMKELGIFVKIAGVEAVMANIGALTTPGTALPLCVLDLGGGSTDVSIMDASGELRSDHLAGAGELVTLLIQTELGLKDRHLAEQIKRYPAAKVESLFHIRLENDSTMFFDEPLDAKLYGRVVLIDKNSFIKVDEDVTMERIVQVRREAKKKIFLTNAIRGLKRIALNNDLKNVHSVVLVGGSAEDFEISEMLTTELASYKILCGRGNIRCTEGPRNAVATGLVASFLG